jgi:c-di-GMP-binding flagellar brake protein YcgR
MVTSLDGILQANDLVAVLGREVSVRLLDISASGCLLESASALLLGTTGSLLLKFDGKEYVDDVRIIRCRQCEGSNGAYLVGAEFLWTNAPHDRSLRRVLSQLQATAVKAAGFERRM